MPTFPFTVTNDEVASSGAARLFTDIALDENGDLDSSDGDLHLLSDLDAVKQDITIRLQMFRGEWFLDTEEGMPYFQEILVKNPNINAIKTLFANAILSTPTVTSVNNLALDYDKALRTLLVSFDATSTLVGPIDYERKFTV